MATLKERYQEVVTRIQQAEQQYQREPGSVQLLAVSKKQPASAIRALYNLGQRRFGENYWQEASDKIQACTDLNIEWHFIGRIQSRKTRDIAEHFHWVHSVASVNIAERLARFRPTALEPLNICLQVNIDAEPSKGGVLLNELPELVQAVNDLPNIALRGLMALPRQRDDFAGQREPFQQLAQAFVELQQQGIALDTLSMGMSIDLEAAIAEGATIVRVGTALFGPRK